MLTADCVPILLYAEKAAVIGAIHAGWRGARFGIIGSTVRAMQNLGSEDIIAVIGPCIHQTSYEVGQDFVQLFSSESAANNEFFKPSEKPGHHMFDLPGYVEMKLFKNGISKVKNLGEDTCSQPEKFYSYRRSATEGKKEYGRQLKRDQPLMGRPTQDFRFVSTSANAAPAQFGHQPPAPDYRKIFFIFLACGFLQD